MQMSPGPLYMPLEIRAQGTQANTDTLGTALTINNKLFFASDQGVSHLLLD